MSVVLPVLGEVPDVPLELIVRARQADQPAFGRRIGDEPHVYNVYVTYRPLQDAEEAIDSAVPMYLRPEAG